MQAVASLFHGEGEVVAYKLVIFDFDGTLADTFPWFMRVVNGVADKYRFKRIEDHEVETLRGYSARQMVAHLGVPFWKLPLIARHMRAISGRDIHELSLFEGVTGMLQQLSVGGVALAIVSSNSEENVRRALGPHVATIISHYACGASLYGKPAKLRRVLQESRVQRHKVIYIGDEIRDHEAAQQRGIAFGAVTWGYTTSPALTARAPEFVFTSPEEIVTRIAPST